MQIVKHRFVDAPFRQASGCGGKLAPTLVIAHDTAGAISKGNVVNYFAGAGCRVSAHIVLERDGTFTQMVDFATRAWHADPSSWDGKAGCNWRAVGIEIVNPGMMERRGQEVLLIYRDRDPNTGQHRERIVGRYPIKDCVSVDTPEHGKGWCLPYTPEQIATMKQICRALADTYPISDIVTHWMVAPKRKVDTTPLFPLEEVRAFAFNKGEVPVAEEEPPAVMPDPVALTSQGGGWFSEANFTKVNELAAQGSRLGTALRNFGRWFWSLLFGTAAASGSALMADPNKGTAAVVASNPKLLWIIAGSAIGALVVGVAAYLFIKFRIVPHLVTAARDGRYKPRGA